MSAQWPLLIAGNRDEWWSRPTLALHKWQTPAGTPIWAGRDEVDGGTWLALTPDAKACALVTNVRQGQTGKGVRSRGQLPLLWIDAVTKGSSHTFFDQLAPEQYGRFNLICGQPIEQRWWYYNNVDGGHPVSLERGIYGLSNARIDSPWPKSIALKTRLNDSLQSQAAQSFETIVQHMVIGLCDAHPYDERLLPSTGLDVQTERTLSSVFVDWPQQQYGTCTSHVLALTSGWQPLFWEATYRASAQVERHKTSTVYNLP